MKNEVLNEIKIKAICPHDFTTSRFQSKGRKTLYHKQQCDNEKGYEESIIEEGKGGVNGDERRLNLEQ